MRKGLLVLMVLLVMFAVTGDASAAKKKKRYADWKAVATDMGIVFNQAAENIEKGEYKAAHKNMNDAYFGYYEIQGFEKNVMVVISSKRVNHIEARFAAIKHVLLGNNDSMNMEQLIESVDDLKVKVYKDAMVLDGDIDPSEPDSLGEAIYAKVPKYVLSGAAGTSSEETKPADVIAAVAADGAAAEKAAAEDAAVKAEETAPAVVAADEKAAEPAAAEPAPAKKKVASKDWLTFVTAFGLLLREGLEAILVIVAIVAYLIKTGNKHMLKSVYLGSLAAIAASIVLAWFLNEVMGDASGVARELLEGWTMFLAVVVLFYVSNWMLSKADTIAWQNYVEGLVTTSIDKKSQWTLVFAAFISVMREGAELILFYQAAFGSGMSDPKYIVYGIAAGAVALAAVYIAFRYFSVKLPLRGFFLFTSILLFLMCISFMGAGVVELTEADVITGRTVIPAMNGFSIEILNIYDRAETLIPQIMLFIAAAWCTIPHLFRKKSK